VAGVCENRSVTDVFGVTRKVRLVAAGGQAAEDDIGESATALVLANGPFPQPWTVELQDAAGGIVRSHAFHGGRPR
jgi:hypothetical protein